MREGYNSLDTYGKEDVEPGKELEGSKRKETEWGGGIKRTSDDVAQEDKEGETSDKRQRTGQNGEA